MREGDTPPEERARASFETNESEEVIPPDRPTVWPETPRPPRPQVKRPLEDWLSDFTERIKQQDAQARDRPQRGRVERRRRPRGLARIIPIPIAIEKPVPEAEARAAPERRGRRRTKGTTAPTREDRRPAQPGPRRERRRRRDRRPQVVRPDSPPPTNTHRPQPGPTEGGVGRRRSRRGGRRRRPRGPSGHQGGPPPSS